MDVTIRGGGVFGLAIGWDCARRGAKVRLIERLAIGAGASGGPVGALAPHVPEQWDAKKAFQFEALTMAASFWAAVAAASDLPTGYAATGRLQSLLPGRTALALAQGAAALQGIARWM